MPFLPIFAQERQHGAAIVGAGGAQAGGTATFETSARARRRQAGGGYEFGRRVTAPLREAAIVAEGGAVAGGRATMESHAVRVGDLVAVGGARGSGEADVAVATPFRTNRAYANDWLISEELLDRDAA
jgi:hypothetical protein